MKVNIIHDKELDSVKPLDLYLKETINLNMIDPKILSNEIMRMKNVLYCEVVTSERVDVTFKNI